MEDKRLLGLRGAVCCKNDTEDIELRVAQLFDALVSNNGLDASNVVSLIFSVTDDLTAMNPAAALRKSGRGADLALFCCTEPHVENSLPRVIRILIHYYGAYGSEPMHAYLNGAEILRPDWSARHA